MSYIDLLIIYLACGAPFGVYYFFQQRESSKMWQKSPMPWLNCVIITLFWIPFAFKLLQEIVTKKFRKSEFVEKNQADSILTTKIDCFEKSITQILFEEKTTVQLFEFRETFQRYVGLTLAISTNENSSKTTINDFFQVVNHENPKLATICLNRRNRLRLESHQTLARKDFLRMIETLNSCLVEKEKLSSLAFDFAKLINDVELLEKLRQIFENKTQTAKDFTVKKMENEVWNPREPKPLPTQKTALNLKVMSARAMMSKQD